MASFLHNIGYANQGIVYFFKTERNGRIQAVVASVIIILALVLQISPIEWCFILACIAMVLGLEMTNTALERVCEMLSKDFHPIVKVIKDVAAGAVWVASIFSSVIGAIIFYPYVLKFFQA